MPEIDELKELAEWIETQIDTLLAAPLCYPVNERVDTYQTILDKINDIMEERSA